MSTFAPWQNFLLMEVLPASGCKSEGRYSTFGGTNATLREVHHYRDSGDVENMNYNILQPNGTSKHVTFIFLSNQESKY